MLSRLVGRARQSLRIRTALLFLLGGVTPILLSGLAAWNHFEAELVQRMVEDHRRLIGQLTHEIANELSWYRGQVEKLGTQVPVQSMQRARMEAELESFLAFHPLFHLVRVFSPEGKLRARARRGAQVEEADVSDAPPSFLRDAIADALQASRTTVTAPYRNESGRVEIHVVAPVTSFVDEQPPCGAVAATLRLHGHEVSDIVEPESFISGSTYMCLTDPDGRVLARAGAGLPGHLRTLAVASPPSELSGGDILAGTAVVAGRRDLIASATVAALGIRVVVGRPYAEVRSALAELLRSIAFHVTTGILLALLLGVYLSQGLVGPILSLVKGIQRVARGEVAHRIPVERTDELGRAAEAFNEMATQLEKGRLLEELWQARWQPGRKP